MTLCPLRRGGEGMEGVATFWKRELDKNVRALPDGSHRILVIEVNTKGKPLLIVNVYMPSRNGGDGTEYDDTLSELSELFYKFGPTHEIILLGDMNASIHRVHKNTQDRKFQNFCSKHNIIIDEKYPPTHTFFHHNGVDTGTLDYILTEGENPAVGEIVVRENDHTNVSDHKLVYTSLRVELSLGSQDVKENLPTHPRRNWEKCDKSVYRLHLTQNFPKINKNVDSLYDITEMVQEITSTIKIAEKKAFGNKKRKKSKNTKIKWTPEISKAIKESKIAHNNWKKGGRPTDKEDPLYITRKLAKQNLRRIQRKDSAIERAKLYNEISQANINSDQKLFYRLVNKQRSQPSENTDHINIDGKIYSEYDNIIEGFENLSKPKACPTFDEEHKTKIEFDNLVIESLCNNNPKPIQTVSEDQVRKVILALKNNKAADLSGLTAEHLKIAIDEVVSPITTLINAILQKADVPTILKTGVLTPILKKGKDKTNPGSYRGITVNSLLGKILETCIRDYLEPILDPSQNKLQRGFTQSTSPLMAGLLISEAFFDAKDSGAPLVLQTFDAEKAFDVVWHDSLLRKIHKDGVEGDLWKIVKSLHTDAYTLVKWQGEMSEHIQMRQGIRQGAKLSTLMYKRFNNDLLDILQSAPEGVKIGTLDVSSPTCADDTALLTNKQTDAQIFTNIIDHASSMDRFTINPLKSEILVFKTSKRTPPKYRSSL